MLKFRSPIYREKQEKTIVLVNCFHCAKVFLIATQEIRRINYCPTCR